MKKLLLFALPLVFILNSCSKDDDPSSDNAALVGIWAYQSSSGTITIDGTKHDINDPDLDFEIAESDTYEFRADGTGVSDANTGYEATFKYSVSGDRLTITYDDSENGVVKGKFEVSGSDLIVSVDENDLRDYVLLAAAFGINISDIDAKLTYKKQ